MGVLFALALLLSFENCWIWLAVARIPTTINIRSMYFVLLKPDPDKANTDKQAFKSISQQKIDGELGNGSEGEYCSEPAHSHLNWEVGFAIKSWIIDWNMF